MIRQALLTLFVVALCADGITQDELRFNSSVEVVLVETSVRRSGQTVSGLTADDFVVRDNGVVQKVRLIDNRETEVNVVLILDRSESVAGDEERSLNRAATSFVNRLRPIDSVALISFHHHVSLEQDLTRDHGLILDALQRRHTRGETALYDSLYAGVGIASSREGRSALVLFTDGEDTASVVHEEDIRTVLDYTNAVVYVVGSLPSLAETVRDEEERPQSRWVVGWMTDLRRSAERRTRLLRYAADLTGGQMFDVDDTDRLEEVFARIGQDMETRYLISFVPQGVESGGWHEIEVRLKEGIGKVNSRRGYLRP